VRFKLKAGSEVDVLTKDELRAGITEGTKSWFQERARGVSTARFQATGTPDGSGNLVLPGPGERPMGPEVGFAWTVQRITADGLADGDVLVVYRNSATPSNRMGIITPDRFFHAGSKGALFRGDERIIITGAGLTATDDVTINGEAIDVSESDLYKVI
jgi:hypothetical protein